MLGFSLTLKVGGAEGARTPDPHNAIVLPALDHQPLMIAFKNIDRFIDSFFSCLGQKRLDKKCPLLGRQLINHFFNPWAMILLMQNKSIVG